MTLTIGTLLHNRYRIVSILGQGGMGAVYRAIDENLGVEVAVKENLFLTDEYAKQFQLEASILANLRQPNLPRVGDYFILEGQGQYLVMDYVGGEDLRQRIERMNNLPENEVILIGALMCDALSYLHTRVPPVIHRDIKPGNIKITSEGSIILVDFGLAKVMQEGQATTTGARAMTPGYSPPEQYGIARTDSRSDIYSLGATLYAALTGIIPEDGLARATGKAQLTPITRLQPRVNRRLAAALEKALALDMFDRFQSAEDFKKTLLAAGDISQVPNVKLVISPPPRSTPPFISVEDAVNKPNDSGNEGDDKKRIPKVKKGRIASIPQPSERRRLTGGGVFVLLLVLVAVGIYFYYPSLPTMVSKVYLPTFVNWFIPSPSATIEIVVPSTSTPEPSITSLPTNTSQSTATHTPTQTKSSTPTRTPIPTKTATRTVIANKSITPTKNYTATITPIPSPTLLGGGVGQIAFASDAEGSMQIWLMNADGTNRQRLTNMLDGACQPVWSPDGDQLAFISPCLTKQTFYDYARIYIYSFEENEAQILPVTGESKGDFDPAWSPDGRVIAFTSLRNGVSHIYTFDLETQELVEVTNDRFSDRQPAWSPDGHLIAFVRQFQYSQIWLLDVESLTAEQYSPNSTFNAFLPVWHPDSNSIFYCQAKPESLVPFLVRVNFEDRLIPGKELRILPADLDKSIPLSEASISPDGRWLLFESWPDGIDHNIYLMTIMGNEAQLLTESAGFNFGAVWRPVKVLP